MNWNYTHTLKTNGMYAYRFDCPELGKANIGYGSTEELAKQDVLARIRDEFSDAEFIHSASKYI